MTERHKSAICFMVLYTTSVVYCLNYYYEKRNLTAMEDILLHDAESKIASVFWMEQTIMASTTDDFSFRAGQGLFRIRLSIKKMIILYHAAKENKDKKLFQKFTQVEQLGKEIDIMTELLNDLINKKQMRSSRYKSVTYPDLNQKYRVVMRRYAQMKTQWQKEDDLYLHRLSPLSRNASNKYQFATESETRRYFNVEPTRPMSVKPRPKLRQADYNGFDSD